MPFCSNCGKEVKEGTKFCSGCGASLSDETETTNNQQDSNVVIQCQK